MTATVTDKQGNVIEELTQWDSNRTIYIHGLTVDFPPAVHFSNGYSKKSYSSGSTLEDDVIVTTIPNVLLEQSDPISIYIYDYNVDTREGRTIELVKLPVRPKKKPDDYIYKENVTVVNVVALNNYVRDLYALLPNEGSINGYELKINNETNGRVSTLFSFNLGEFVATDEEAYDYLFGGIE